MKGNPDDGAFFGAGLRPVEVDEPKRIPCRFSYSADGAYCRTHGVPPLMNAKTLQEVCPIGGGVPDAK